jgi:hypothetical protein
MFYAIFNVLVQAKASLLNVLVKFVVFANTYSEIL